MTVCAALVVWSFDWNGRTSLQMVGLTLRWSRWLFRWSRWFSTGMVGSTFDWNGWHSIVTIGFPPSPSCHCQGKWLNMTGDHYVDLIIILTVVPKVGQVLIGMVGPALQMVGQVFQMVGSAFVWHDQSSQHSEHLASAQLSPPSCKLRDNRVIITI